jgi:hypothetical protein
MSVAREVANLKQYVNAGGGECPQCSQHKLRFVHYDHAGPYPDPPETTTCAGCNREVPTKTIIFGRYEGGPQ